MSDMKASYSQITLHRKCAQAWFYRYDQGLQQPQDEQTPPRDFGSWWHAVKAAESLERGRAADSLRSIPESIRTVDDGPEFDGTTVTVEEVLDGARDWWKRMSEESRETWEKWLGQPVPERLEYMLARWEEEYAGSLSNEKPLAVEMYWERALPLNSTVTGLPDFMLQGYVDEVFYDEQRRMVVVRDHKTSGALATQTTVDDMMDSQLQLYAWGATPTVAEWGLGQVRALSYDRLASIAPKEPVVTQAGSLSKSVTKFDLHTYTTWAQGPEGLGVPFPGRKKDGSAAGLYTSEETVVEALSSPAARTAWLQRTLVPLNANMVRAHLRAAVDSAQDIFRTQTRSADTGEAARSLSPTNCKFCEYAPLCRAQMAGGPRGEYDPADFGLETREARRAKR